MTRLIGTRGHKLAHAIASMAIAMVAAIGLLTALPAGQAQAAQTTAPTSAQTANQTVPTSWGFSVRLWKYTVADPWGVYRVYYSNKCNPKPGVRYLKMSTSWIYTTYECWAILA